jgi:hypothetical protein
MAKKVVKKSEFTEELKTKLQELLIIKAEIKELEAKSKKLEAVVFEKPEILPKEFLVDFDDYEKEYKLIVNAPRVDITQAMIKAAGIDPAPLYPFATFATGKIETMMGKPTVEKIKATKEYKEVEKTKSKTYYYKG